MYRVYPRANPSVKAIISKINRMEMDIKVRSLSPRAQEVVKKEIDKLRLKLR